MYDSTFLAGCPPGALTCRPRFYLRLPVAHRPLGPTHASLYRKSINQSMSQSTTTREQPSSQSLQIYSTRALPAANNDDDENNNNNNNNSEEKRYQPLYMERKKKKEKRPRDKRLTFAEVEQPHAARQPYCTSFLLLLPLVLLRRQPAALLRRDTQPSRLFFLLIACRTLAPAGSPAAALECLLLEKVLPQLGQAFLVRLR